jgi:conjugative transfer signal peptidase TraF
MSGFRTLTLGAIAVGIAMGSAYASGIRWNMTPSMPLGIWRVDAIQGPVTRGEIVTLCLDTGPADLGRKRGYLVGGECPGNVELLIKRVAAVRGDLVRISDAGMAVNGALIPGTAPLPFDDLHRGMLAVPHGIYRVEPDQVWVIGDADARSFDSRYFGPVPTANLRGRAEPLFIQQEKSHG